MSRDIKLVLQEWRDNQEGLLTLFEKQRTLIEELYGHPNYPDQLELRLCTKKADFNHVVDVPDEESVGILKPIVGGGTDPWSGQSGDGFLRNDPYGGK